MADLVYREPSIIPATLEDAQWLKEHRERREAMARGDWLPDGWEWVDGGHAHVPEDSVGAWDRQHNIVVYVCPPEWSCPYCTASGPDRFTSTTSTGDFLDQATRDRCLAEWRASVCHRSVLRVHGYGAPIIVFDMVWRRFTRVLDERHT